MNKINWGGVVVGGLVAGLVWTFLSITLLSLMGGEFLAATEGNRPRDPGGTAHAFLLACNFGAGIWGMWIYAAMLPRYGPGPKTALLAGLAWWSMASMQSAKWVALVGVPLRVVPGLLLATLAAIMLAMLAGAKLYKE